MSRGAASLLVAAVLLSLAPCRARAQTRAQASALDQAAPEAPAWRAEIGLRAVAGTGRTRYDLFDAAGAMRVSALDFHGTSGAGAEFTARLVHAGRFFATATLGLASRGAGTLRDEDFEIPGLTSAYSSTDSAQHGGGAWLLMAAAGYDLLQAPAGRLGLTAGFRRAGETLDAWGCRQTAGNQQICGGTGIPGSVKVITAETTWTSPLLGVDGALRLGPALVVTGAAAALPLTAVEGTDTHWLRIGPQAQGFDFRGPTPITASGGLGGLVEASLRLAIGARLSLALGGRLTRIEARHGLMHFERSAYPVGGQAAVAQVVALRTERVEGWFEVDGAF
jgi:hypothetical protein